MAHLAEHLSFRSRLPNGYTAQEALEYAGAVEYNAVTESDLTSYLVSGTRSTLPALLAVAKAWLSTSDPIAPDEFEAERKVVEAELNRGQDSIHGPFQAWVREALYPPEVAAGRTSSVTSLRAITSSDLADFRARHYRAANATLVISGGVETADVDRLLAGFFGSAGARVAHEQLKPIAGDPPPLAPFSLRRYSVPLASNELVITWSIPVFATPVPHQYLELALASWLWRMSDDERGILDAQVVSNRGLAEASLSVRILFAPSADPSALFRKTTKRIETMQSIQASAGTQARRTVRPFEMSALERALERGRLAELTGEVVLNAPAAAQTNLAREFRWLSAARARGFVISSGSSQNSTAVSSAHSITDISRSTMRPSIQFSPPAVASVALPIDPQDLRSAQLSNGMRIVALKTGHFPLVAFSLLVPGGDSVSTPPGATTWAQVLGKQLELFPGKWSTYPFSTGSASVDAVESTLQVPVARIEATFLRVKALLERRWHVSSSRLTYAVRTYEESWRSFSDSLQTRASTAFLAALWRGHAYGSRHQRDGARKLDANALEAWLTRVYSPTQAVLVVAGDLDPDAIVTMARTHLDSLGVDQPIAQPPPPSYAPARPRYLVTPLATAKEVSMRWGCLTEARTPQDEAANQLLGAWLRQQVTKTMREERGLTYAPGTESVSYWGGSGALESNYETLAAESGTALQLFRQALDAPVSREALLAAAWEVLRQRNGLFEVPAGPAFELALEARASWSVSSMAQWPQILTTTSIEQFTAARAHCQGTQVFSLMGDVEAIRHGMKEAGVSEAELEVLQRVSK